MQAVMNFIAENHGWLIALAVAILYEVKSLYPDTKYKGIIDFLIKMLEKDKPKEVKAESPAKIEEKSKPEPKKDKKKDEVAE